jgi:transcriptional regulator with XRE-family HTH domain
MKVKIHETIRARRLALGLSQAEAARRSGIQQRQVSLFERGGDVTLSTLLKLAQALDVELIPVPREDTAKVKSLLKAKRGLASAASTPAPTPSLLDRYQVRDDDEQSNG